MTFSRPPFTGVLLGPGPESAPRSAFWAILGTCLGVPQRVLFECFLTFLGPKNAKKHSKNTLWGTPRQVPKIAQKALQGALSGPGPTSTPVNGGRDRNTCDVFTRYFFVASCIAPAYPSIQLSFFRGFFVALICLEKQCLGLFRGFFVALILGKFHAYSP